MPAFTTNANIEIAADINTVRKALVDFKSWPVWSPWLYVEPDSKVAFHGTPSEIGSGNSWHGDKTGEGSITLVKNAPSRLEMDLEFIKPFKSHADVYFDLKKLPENKTHVRWGMDSSLPFFMFWMTDVMVAMIRSDYRRGLLLLKDYIETGSISSKATLDGIHQIEAMPYVGLHGVSAMENIGSEISQQFEALEATVASMNTTEIFTICNKLNIKADSMDYTAAFGVSDAPILDAPLVRGTRAACKALKVTHVGPYHHLGNAWYMAISEQRHAKHKLVKTAPAFEVYRNSPKDTAENDLITEIYIPIK